MSDQLTPHSIPAEQAAIGSVLIDPSKWAELASLVDSADYYRQPGHGFIHQTCEALTARGIVIDPLTVSEDLEARGRLDDAGGRAYIFGLTDGVPRSSNVAHYASIIREKKRGRDLQAALRRAHDLVTTSGPDAATEYLNTLVGTFTEQTRVRVASGTDLILTPDLPVLHLEWPLLARGTTAALVAASGTGKTALELRMIADLLRAGHRVAVCALEGYGGLKNRLLALCAAFDLKDEHLERVMFIDTLQLGDDASINTVIRIIGLVDVIFVDTWGRALGDLDENSSNCTGKALNSCSRLSRDCGGAAVVIIHHTNRHTSSERGSSAFRAGVDALAFLEDEGETRVLRYDKMRDCEIPAARAFRIRQVPDTRSFVLDDAHRVLPAGSESELSAKTQMVLRELRMSGPSKATAVSDALKGHVGRSTVYGALEALERLALARQDRGTWTASPTTESRGVQ